MVSRIRQIFLTGLVILLYGFLLNSCQAFEQPPAGVLTPQELILTSAAETIIADLAPLGTPELPVETNTAFPTDPDISTSTSEPSPPLTHTPIPELAPFLTQTPAASPITTPTPLETIIPSPTTILSPAPAETALPSPTTTLLPSPVPTEPPTTMPSVATPFPNLIYEDDFSIRAGWVIEETDGFGMYYQAGGYRIHNRSSSSNVSSTRSFEHPDIRVEVDAIRVRWSLGGYYGVVCRFQNFQNMYAFVIGGDGFHAIAKIQQGEVSFLREGQMQNGSIYSEGEVNRISGICQGSQLALEVNGQRLLEMEDFTFDSGYVGLVVGNQDPPGNLIHFDNFALYAP
jgi:hypothetical protein